MIGSAIFLSTMLGMQQDQDLILASKYPVEEQMKAAKLIYSDLPAFWNLKFTVDQGKRNQSVYIRKTQEEYLSLKVHEVFGIIWESDKPASPEFMNTVFLKRFSSGGLIYELPSATQKFYRIRYRMTIFEDHSQERFVQLINIVATTSDSLEKELNPGAEDKF
jgi:hypothetical protein